MERRETWGGLFISHAACDTLSQHTTEMSRSYDCERCVSMYMAFVEPFVNP